MVKSTVWHKVWIEVHLFAYENPILPTPIVDKILSFLQQIAWVTVKNPLLIYVWEYLSILCSVALIYFSIFTLIPDGFHYMS